MTYGQPLNSQVRGGDPGTWLQWFTGAVPVTALGLVVLAVVFGAIGYIVAGWSWRVWIASTWRRRQRYKRNDAHPDSVRYCGRGFPREGCSVPAQGVLKNRKRAGM